MTAGVQPTQITSLANSPAAAVLRDGKGDELAGGTISPTAIPQVWTLQRITHGKGVLLRYYFERGLRAVWVETADGTVVTGSLTTRWIGAEREWSIRLSHRTGAAECP